MRLLALLALSLLNADPSSPRASRPFDPDRALVELRDVFCVSEPDPYAATFDMNQYRRRAVPLLSAGSFILSFDRERHRFDESTFYPFVRRLIDALDRLTGTRLVYGTGDDDRLSVVRIGRSEDRDGVDTALEISPGDTHLGDERRWAAYLGGVNLDRFDDRDVEALFRHMTDRYDLYTEDRYVSCSIDRASDIVSNGVLTCRNISREELDALSSPPPPAIYTAFSSGASIHEMRNESGLATILGVNTFRFVRYVLALTVFLMTVCLGPLLDD